MDLLDHLAPAGVLSAADARLAGIDGEALARHCRSGCIVRLTGGWYAVRPPADARDRHWLTATALGRAYAGRALVSHHSALVLLGLPTYDVDLSVVHLTRLDPRPGTPAPRLAARRRGLVLHQPLADVIPRGRRPRAILTGRHTSRLSSRSSGPDSRAPRSPPSWQRMPPSIASW